MAVDSKKKKLFAKDFKCKTCGKQAEIFLGLADPDSSQIPYCKKCAPEARRRLLKAYFRVKR